MVLVAVWATSQLPFRPQFLDTQDMYFLLLGFGLGIVAVGVPGPVSLSLIQVATAQGRASGARAAIGVAGGDLILSIIAVVLVTAGRSLPDGAFVLLQRASAATLLAFGAVMLLRPAAMGERAASVSRPFRAFLAFTTLLPTALGGWLAFLAAMPFANDRQSLAVFALGVVILSVVWHLFLGLGAGAVGPRLTPTVLRVATRLGGAATVGLGVWAVS